MRYSLISKYRTEIMGFATLWIAFLHAGMWVSFPLLQGFKMSGHGGVDVFLFLSAFGLYYSYQKGSTGWTFLKHRFSRILPVFLPVAIARIIYYKYDFTSGFYLLTTLAFWLVQDRSMWFISAIAVFYLVTPLYLHYFKDGREEKMTLMMFGVGILFFLLFHDITQMVFAARVPVYFMGFLAGKYAMEDREVKHPWLCVCSIILGFVILRLAYHYDQYESLLWGKGMFFYPNILIAWPLCLLLGKGFDLCRNTVTKGIRSIFTHLGSVSLEFYLLHEMCMRFFSGRIILPASWAYHGIALHMIIIVLTYVIALIYHTVIRYITEVCER